jgi:hypothetical protein
MAFAARDHFFAGIKRGNAERRGRVERRNAERQGDEARIRAIREGRGRISEASDVQAAGWGLGQRNHKIQLPPTQIAGFPEEPPPSSVLEGRTG